MPPPWPTPADFTDKSDRDEMKEKTIMTLFLESDLIRLNQLPKLAVLLMKRGRFVPAMELMNPNSRLVSILSPYPKAFHFIGWKIRNIPQCGISAQKNLKMLSSERKNITF